MPDLDGYALAEGIRESAHGHGAAGHHPVLDRPSRARPGIEAVSSFLLKPVKPSALHDAMVTVLPRPRSRSGDGRQPTQRRGRRIRARRAPSTAILLAEDNAVNQKLALRLLSEIGYEADVATNGLEAIAGARRSSPTTSCFMDVQMPELDGLEATRQVRAGKAGEASRDVRIVAMTANAMAGDRELCLAAGMDDYVCKPIRPAELAAALAAHDATAATTDA